MNKIVFFIFNAGFILPLLAQETDLHGKIQLNNSVPLEGVHVWLYDLSDTTKHYVTPTNASGVFHFYNIHKGIYRFEASFVGYAKIMRMIHIDNPNTDLGTFIMTKTPIKLGDVIVQGRVPPAVQKGDTTEFNANAFKTHPDATVEELVTKMPGITVDNTGTVQSNGETVQRVLVDGKPFFGDDPTLAMRNLPAEVVEKIQVFDQMSDQAQFTGFDDGQYTKTMNIVTRRRNASSEFGKLTAGYGDNDRYNASGNMNFFNGNSRVSLLGSSNNTNTQNFSTQDLLGVLSGNNRQQSFGRNSRGSGQRQGNRQRGGMFTPGGGNTTSNFLIGQLQGLNTTSLLGGNYTDTVLENTFLHANYFFNQTNNQNDQSLSRQYLLTGDSSSLYNQQSDINGKNYNHRVNARVDYAFDSSNIFTMTPQLLFQDNKSTNLLNAVSSLPSGIQLSQSQTGNQTTTTGNSLSGHLLFRHKFATLGRTISLDINISESLKKNSGNLNALNMYGDNTIDSASALNEQSGGTWQSLSLTPSLVYTEPIGLNSQLEINYQPTVSKGTADKQMYNFDSTVQQYSIFNSALSNRYENLYAAQRGGVAYRFSNQRINFNFSVAYQQADLWNEQIFPVSLTISRMFTSILPNAMFNMKISNGENLRIYYQTTTRAPSITQLQNVVDNSNPLLLTAGNSDLKQSYTHTLLSRYSITLPDKGRSIFLLLAATYTLDYIGSASITPSIDTVILGTHIAPGAQLTLPQNFDGFWSVRSFLTYGFPLDFISSTMNLNGGINYTQTPGSINNELNISHAYTFTTGAVIGSNISPNLDFTLTYMGNYNLSRNSLQSSLNTDYYSHTAGLRFNWIFWQGVVFHNEMMNALNNGLGTGYNQNSLLWNMSLAKKFFSNQAGELKLSVNDLLAQNKSLARTITSSYIEDSRNEVLTRYVMLTFTYTMR